MSIVKEEMLAKKVCAVAGVTAKTDRYGYKIWKKLKEHGYEAHGINPNYDEIEGERVYHSLKELTMKIDVLDMVVSPKIAINTLEEAKEIELNMSGFNRVPTMMRSWKGRKTLDLSL